MEIKFIDHIVLVVKDLFETEKFYSSFLGEPIHKDNESLAYEVGGTKIFLTVSDGEFESSDKDKGGLNHLAFGVNNLEELTSFESILNKHSIQNSGIKTDPYGHNEFIWFNDPSGYRLEIYCRLLK